MTVLKIARFWPSFRRADGAGPAIVPVDVQADALEAFGSESPIADDDAEAPEPTPAPVSPEIPSTPSAVRHHPRLASPATLWVVLIVFALFAVSAAGFEYRRRVAARTVTGALTIETVPPGVEILIGSKPAGITPLTVSLAPGAYDVQLGRGNSARTVRVSVTAGATIVQHFELASSSSSPADPGALRIETQPARLPVLVDGVDRGTSPVTVEGLNAGDHDVAVRTEQGIVRQRVAVKPRETFSLILSAMAPRADAGVVAGWLSLTCPVPLQIREQGRTIGSTDVDRIMLSAGDHELELVNDSLGFAVRRKVQIAPGKTAAVRVDVPNGTLSVNAVPWAEVFIDGERVGETPLGNLSRPIGRHEILFRHPELGERRETVLVTTQQPARLGVDLRKK